MMALELQTLLVVLILSCFSNKMMCFQQDSVISPCSETKIGQNITVDCSNLSLLEIYAEWFPEKTTILRLDKNKLIKVPSTTFSHLRHLRYLSMSNNIISSIEPNAFVGLQELALLRLDCNRLQYSSESFPPDVFDPLENLRELRLWQEIQTGTEYPERFLSRLKKLSKLSIDTVGLILNLHEQFRNLTSLVRLELTGKIKIITNTSFENVRQVKELMLWDMPRINGNMDSDILKHFVQLDSLKIEMLPMGVANALRILQPLANTTMSVIDLEQVYYTSEGQTSTLENDEILDGKKTEYLSNICVRHFALRASFVQIVKKDVFRIDSNIYNCLESIDLSKNQIVGETFALYKIMSLQNLKLLVIENDLLGCQKRRLFSDSISFQEDLCLSDKADQMNRILTEELQQEKEKGGTLNFGAEHTRKNGTEKELNGGLHSIYAKTHSATRVDWPDQKQNMAQVLTSISFHAVGKLIHILKLPRLFRFTPVNENVSFQYPNNINYLDMSDDGLYDFRGTITGLFGLQTLLISGNTANPMSKSFFDNFGNLTGLAMAECRMDGPFMSQYSSRLFQKMPLLRKLDISSNSLSVLSRDTFAANNDIEELNIAGNEFQSVPFELKYTPKLKLLDLRGNFIASLDEDVTNAFDNLATQQEGFRLYLSENEMSCGCQNIRFLKWLRRTQVQLDNNGNYTCRDSFGVSSYTMVYEDLFDLWRVCNGQFFFVLSISLLSSMVIGLLLFFLIWKRKFLVKSILMQIFFGFKLKKPSDYNIGVFIGYSEKDYHFPTHDLKRFIEDKLRLSTYDEHMNPVPGACQVSAVCDAIEDSWRILLVLTDSFVDRNSQSIITMKLAIFALSQANPGRIVVLVHSNLVNKTPPELLSVVPEDNVIVLSDWALTYEGKEQLRTRILSI